MQGLISFDVPCCNGVLTIANLTPVFSTLATMVIFYTFLFTYDILITRASILDIKALITRLHFTFGLKVLGSIHYFLGFEFHRDSHSIWLNINTNMSMIFFTNPK